MREQQNILLCTLVCYTHKMVKTTVKKKECYLVLGNCKNVKNLAKYKDVRAKVRLVFARQSLRLPKRCFTK